jgi:DedD protein
MEQQKILWIIFSVTLLLIVVLGAGFLWFFPSDSRISPFRNFASRSGDSGSEPAVVEPGNEESSEEGKIEFDPIEWVRKAEDFPGLEEEAEETPEDFIIVYGETQTVEEKREEEPTKETVIPQPVVVKPVQRTIPEPAPVIRQRPAPVVEKPKPRSERLIEYWIQAGSYTAKDRAEQVKNSLQEKGVVSRITSREVDGETYFRVRIGPYENSGEADKFLEWIRNMRGFESSYVSQVYVTRTVN